MIDESSSHKLRGGNKDGCIHDDRSNAMSDVVNDVEDFDVFDSHCHASIYHDNDVEYYALRKCSKNAHTYHGNDIGPTCTHLLRANESNRSHLAIIDNNDIINFITHNIFPSYHLHLLIQHAQSNTYNTITIDGTII